MLRTLNNKNFQSGFTLIELLVSMGLFIVIMLIASQAFNKIITQSSLFSKMEESNIEGVIGLEVMRHDLTQMGFGLPWGWSARNTNTPYSTTSPGPLELCETGAACTGLTYAEVQSTLLGSNLNDAPHRVPRAFVAHAMLGNFSSAYMAIKGTSLGRTKASQRWTYISFNNYSANPRESRPVAFASNNPQPSNMVLLVNSNSDSTYNLDHSLIVEPGSSGTATTVSNFSVSFNSIPASYLPTETNPNFMVYGLTEDNSPDSRMPFNRADYFIGQNLSGNVVPPFCAPRTGILYKAVVRHGSSTGGAYDYLPLLDCVADMQIVLGWDSVDSRPVTDPKNSRVDAYSSLPQVFDGTVSAVSLNSDISASAVAAKIKGWLSDPKGLREQLKVVKVYILAQDGKIDRNYKAPTTSIIVGDAAYGTSFAKTYNLTTAQQQYRWKLYKIIVRPKNIVSNAN